MRKKYFLMVILCFLLPANIIAADELADEYSALSSDAASPVESAGAESTLAEATESETELAESAAEIKKKKPEIPVNCNADNVTYNRETNTIIGKGNVDVTYKDNYLKADEVEVHLATKEAEARGNVILSDGESIFTGDRVFYSFETGEANIDGVGSRMDPWFATGEKGERISEKVYYVENGYVSTCDYVVPHYRVRGRHIHIYPEDKIVIRSITVYWGKVPVFYWPYYSKSLKDDQSPWVFIPGKNNKLGYYLIVGYTMWWDKVLGGKLRAMPHVHWYQKRGIGYGVNLKYGMLNRIRSKFRSFYIDDRAMEENVYDIFGNIVSTLKKRAKRYRLGWDYAQQIDKKTRALASLTYLSDNTVLFDYYKDEFQQLIQPKNYAYISRTSRNYQLSLQVRKRLNDFYTVYEQLPQATFSVPKYRLGKTRFLYTGYVSPAYRTLVFAKNIALDDVSSAVFDTIQQLSYPRKYFGWLNIVPRIGTRQTYFSKSLEVVDIETIDPLTGNVIVTQKQVVVDKQILRSNYFTGAEFSTKASRIFYVQSDFWDVNLLRHIIEPRLNYTFQPEPSEPPEHVLGFTTAEAKKNYLGLGLRNKLQTKRDESTWNIIDFNLSTYFYPEKYEETKTIIVPPLTGDPLALPTSQLVVQERSFSHITGRMRFNPFDWLLSDTDFNWDQYDGQIDSFNTEFVLYRGDKVSFGVGYRYLRGLLWDKMLWTSELNYAISSNWSVRMMHRYDFDKEQIEKQEYIVFRDLHCWKAALCYRRYHDIDETNVFFAVYPKAYPKMPFSFGTTMMGFGDDSDDGTTEIDFDAG